MIFQQLLCKERVNETELNRMRNGFIIDTLTSVDFKRIIRIGGKLVEIYEVVIYEENFRIKPFKRVIGKYFELKKSYKDQGEDVTEMLNKLLMIGQYG